MKVIVAVYLLISSIALFDVVGLEVLRMYFPYSISSLDHSIWSFLSDEYALFFIIFLYGVSVIEIFFLWWYFRREEIWSHQKY